MKIEVERTKIEDVLVLKPQVFEDERGFFMEVFRSDIFAELGLPESFRQLNHSRSGKGVVRGLHFQWEPPMGKLMRVTRGSAFVVAVDIRPDSPTLGEWVGRELSESNKQQMWAPASFARGFCVLSDVAEVQYLCTATYNPRAESGVRWNDPQIGIDWPVRDAVLSEKDARAQSLSEWLARPESKLFSQSSSAHAARPR
jgi:dTDP-4-dehydrorhamnose 3,5-epimerase